MMEINDAYISQIRQQTKDLLTKTSFKHRYQVISYHNASPLGYIHDQLASFADPANPTFVRPGELEQSDTLSRVVTIILDHDKQAIAGFSDLVIDQADCTLDYLFLDLDYRKSHGCLLHNYFKLGLSDILVEGTIPYISGRTCLAEANENSEGLLLRHGFRRMGGGTLRY